MAPRAASPSYRNPDIDQEEPSRGRKRRRSSTGLQLASKQMSTLRGRTRHRSLSVLERSAVRDPSASNDASSESEEEIDDATMKIAGIAAGVAVLAAVHQRTARIPAQRAAMLPHMKKLADGMVALVNSTSMDGSDSDFESTEPLSTKAPSKIKREKDRHQPATSHPFQYPLSSASGKGNPVKIKSEKKRRSQSPSRSRSREEKGTPRPRRRQRTQSRSRRHE